MKYFNTSILPKLINKKVLLVSLGVAVILGLVLFGIVRSVQEQNHRTAIAAVEAQERTQKQAAFEARLKALEADSKALRAETQRADLACLELKRLDSIRAITGLITVPAYCTKD